MAPLKKEFRYIRFERGTLLWNCLNKKDNTVLGYIFWYDDWDQYVLGSESNIIWSSDCLEDVREFMALLTEQKKRLEASRK